MPHLFCGRPGLTRATAAFDCTNLIGPHPLIEAIVQGDPGGAAVVAKVAGKQQPSHGKRTHFVLPKLASYVPTDGMMTMSRRMLK
jgi:hypothetical protein